MEDEVRRADANHCFVCGPDNPIGLNIHFRLEEDCCRAEFTPGPHHIGWADQVHGGILYSALDDVMANWLHLQGARAHTARCEVRYRKPLSVGTTLDLEGWLVKRKGKMAQLEAVARIAGEETVVAQASASFMIVEDGKLGR